MVNKLVNKQKMLQMLQPRTYIAYLRIMTQHESFIAESNNNNNKIKQS